MSRLLGLDWGTKRIGVALSDEMQLIAHVPVKALVNNEKVYRQIKELTGQYNVSKVIVGLPLSLSGKETDSAEKARAFGDQIHTKVGLPVEYIDERFTSGAALNAVKARDGRVLGKEDVDNAAAQILLQQYLEKKK